MCVYDRNSSHVSYLLRFYSTERFFPLKGSLFCYGQIGGQNMLNLNVFISNNVVNIVNIINSDLIFIVFIM